MIYNIKYDSEDEKEQSKYSGAYEFQKPKFGHKLTADEAALQIVDPKTGEYAVSTKNVELAKIRSVLVSAPFTVNEKEIEILPVELGEWISEIVGELFSFKKKTSIIITD